MQLRRLHLLAAPLGLWLTACSATAPPPPAKPSPPVVLISIDTLRSDHLPAYGYTGVDTPAIDGLARDGILFARAFSEVPLTLPSHVSILSGKIPPEHGVRDNLGFTVDPQRAPLLQQRLKARGYATGAAVSTRVLAAKTGIAAGFDFYDEPPATVGGRAALQSAQRAGGETLAAALGWLDSLPAPAPAAGAAPFFLFFHLYEPHSPYRPPEPFRSRYANPYDGEIATADAVVGRLLDALRERGIYDRALIVLLGDHGEGLGDHGEDEHGFLLYREELQVPVIVKLPGGERAGERVTRNVALIDVVPTVLEVVGGKGGAPESAGSGISLLARQAPADRPLYAETMYPLIHFSCSELASVVAGDLHLIEAPRPELYDLARDPAETADVYGAQRRAGATLRAFLGGIDRALAAPQEVDAETVAALGSLGYLGHAALPADRSQLPNPRDRVAELEPVLRGMRLFYEGDYRGAVAVLSKAVAGDDPSPHAWHFLGAAYDALGRKEDALRAYRRGMQLAGSPAYLAETAALRMLELGRPQGALEILGGAISRHPESAILRVLQSRALLQTGKPSEAATAADAAVKLDPKLADAYYQRAVVALGRKDGTAAIDDLVAATRLDARHVQARKALAMLRYAQGDVGEARRLLAEAVAIDPDDRDAKADLAQLQAAAGSE